MMTRDLKRSSKLSCVWFAAAIILSSPFNAAAQQGRIFAGYFESWTSNAHAGVDRDLINIPAGVTIVMLAFMKPDARYSGDLRLAGTGLEFDYSGSVLRASILQLRQRNPAVKLFVSVGGEHYTNWSRFNAQEIARFVQDFQLDGVDLDFEPRTAGCVQAEPSISCKSDRVLERSVGELRSALPGSVEISLTCAATAAFGEGQWKDSRPKGGPHYGTVVRFLQNPSAARDISLISLMAYDAGNDYKPLEGLDAIQHYYKGPVLLGLTPPPEDFGPHAYSAEEATALLRAAMGRGAAGAMLFSLRKGTRPGAFTPFAGVISAALGRP